MIEYRIKLLASPETSSNFLSGPGKERGRGWGGVLGREGKAVDSLRPFLIGLACGLRPTQCFSREQWFIRVYGVKKFRVGFPRA